MVANALMVTADSCFISTVSSLIQAQDCMVRIEAEVMKALLYILENEPCIIIVDLSIGEESIIQLLDILKKTKTDIPVIIVYEEESSAVCSDLFERKILCRFKKPLLDESLNHFKLVVEKTLKQSTVYSEINSQA